MCVMGISGAGCLKHDSRYSTFSLVEQSSSGFTA